MRRHLLERLGTFWPRLIEGDQINVLVMASAEMSSATISAADLGTTVSQQALLPTVKTRSGANCRGRGYPLA